MSAGDCGLGKKVGPDLILLDMEKDDIGLSVV
jgi:hypothetical protein